MIFKLRLCGGHSISSKTAWSSFLFKYLLNLFAVCLGSLSCWKVKRGPINRLPDCMAWWMKICLYFSVFIIPSILNKSPTPPAEIQPQTCIDRPPCPTVGCKHGSCNSFPLLLRTNWRYMLPEISNFDCHSTAPSIGQNSSCCVLTHTSIVRIVDNALVSQSLNKLRSKSPILVFFLSISDVTLRYFSSLFDSFLGRPLLGWSSTCPVSWCFFNSAWIPHLDTPVRRKISACDFPCSSNITTLCLVTVNI